MFEIEVMTFNKEKVIKKVINEDLAIAYFKAFTQAEDAKDVTMIDGLTGEILYCWQVGIGWAIFNKSTIGF